MELRKQSRDRCNDDILKFREHRGGGGGGGGSGRLLHPHMPPKGFSLLSVAALLGWKVGRAICWLFLPQFFQKTNPVTFSTVSTPAQLGVTPWGSLPRVTSIDLLGWHADLLGWHA